MTTTTIGASSASGGLAALATILNATGLRKNTLTATGAPGAANDTTQGYEVGSLWFDATNGSLYQAQSVGTGAAVWIVIASGGSRATPASIDDITLATGSYWITGGTGGTFPGALTFGFLTVVRRGNAGTQDNLQLFYGATPSSGSYWRTYASSAWTAWSKFADAPFTSTATGYVPASGGGTTNFLRADGSWAVPAVQNLYTFRTCAATSQNTGAFATKANQMKAWSSGALNYLQVYQNGGSGQTYKAFIAVVNASHVIQSITFSNAVSGVSGGLVLFTFATPVSFAAGDTLAIGTVRTDSTTTAINNSFTLTSGEFNGLGLENLAGYYTLASVLPAVSDTFTRTSGTTLSIQPVYTLSI